MTQDVNTYLNSTGAPSAKFEKVGDKIGGVILDAQLREQTDFATGAVKYYDDGKPMMQVVITLQTNQNDPAIEDDDGRRRIYAKGQMLAELRKAVGRGGIQVGGKLAIKYAANGEAKKGLSAPKHYQVRYEAPPEDLFEEEEPEQEE
jgi:hypothetical protein